VCNSELQSVVTRCIKEFNKSDQNPSIVTHTLDNNNNNNNNNKKKEEEEEERN
jgi:hypothetical protein